MIQIASRLLSAFLLALVAQMPSHSAERTQLVVYSTLEADFLAELKKAFEADHFTQGNMSSRRVDRFRL